MEAAHPRPVTVQLRVNGFDHEVTVSPRTLLSDCLRDDLGLTGTHVGCEHGVCGACTVLVDGHAVRSCLLFAAQAEGADIVTIEGLQGQDGGLHPVQLAFMECHALQCGFCTPGMVIAAVDLLNSCANPGEQQVKEALSGNICRCTGYKNVIEAVLRAVPSAGGLTAGSG